MRPLDLNLASRPFKNNTLPWVGLGTAAVLLVVLTVWNIRVYQINSGLTEDLSRQYAEAQQELEQFDRRERGAQRDIEKYDVEALRTRAGKANEVILWKAFSWTRLFNLLQDVLPHDVKMVSIRPDFRPQRADRKSVNLDAGRIPVSVEGIAKRIEAFFELERALIAHPNFDRVDPEGTTPGADGSETFQLGFLYDPVAPPDKEEVVELDVAGAVAAAEPDAAQPAAEEATQPPAEEAEQPRAEEAEVAEKAPAGDEPLDLPADDPALATDARAKATGGPVVEDQKISPEPTNPRAQATKQPPQAPRPPGTRRKNRQRETSKPTDPDEVKPE